MSRTVPSFAEEGLKRFLHGMDRRLRDVERRGDWEFDTEDLTDEELVVRSGVGQLVILSATGDSIAAGGDYLTFGSIVHQTGFADVVAAGSSIMWPVTAVGEIQIEFEWATYNGGGTVEIEVDGAVPAWGLVGSGTSGRGGIKRRGVHISEGSTVRIKVTQESGSSQTCDVWVEFVIPDPTGTAPISVLKLVDAYPSVTPPSTGYEFITTTGLSFPWDGTGSLILATNPDGTGPVGVDDVLDLAITHEDGSTAAYTYNWNPNCDSGLPAINNDVTAYFEAGVNTIDVACRDWCGTSGKMGAPDIYLVQVP